MYIVAVLVCAIESLGCLFMMIEMVMVLVVVITGMMVVMPSAGLETSGLDIERFRPPNIFT